MESLDLNPIIHILENNNVKFAGIFGSYAKGNADKNSDVDLLVKFEKPKSLLKIVNLERTLSEKLKKKIDLVTEQSISPYIRKDILNDLKLIYGER